MTLNIASETTGQKPIETPEQKPPKKYTECVNCGAETRDIVWDTRYDRWKHYKQCNACINFKHRYGFTLTHADRELLGEPRCAICGTTEGVMHIDHCHTSNKIRGWLCAKHNRGLGLFDDNIEHLHNAINYISTSEEQA